MIVTSEVLAKLKKEMPFKWRVQSQNDYGATCVAYIDSRLAQDLLDEVVGPENWQTTFKVINDNLFCSVGIRVTHDDGTSEWVWKEDVGTESNVDKEKGNASDSFKRACVHFGVGRFLYSLGLQKLKTKKHTNGKLYPCDDKGNILWDGEDLTTYINNKSSIPEKPAAKPVAPKAEEPKQPKYEKPTTEPTYTKAEYSDAAVKKVTALKRGELKGKECLKQYIPDYNKKFGTDYKNVVDFNNDELLNKLIDFIQALPPAGI